MTSINYELLRTENRLLKSCIQDSLAEENEKGNDVMQLAEALSKFHSLIEEDPEYYEGFRMYSDVHKRYFNRLKELGLLSERNDED
jgi:hypothetical protein|tara:strand:- start:98 stop:355 length:258 start_codon:yes stop_codon:yes gene_type:complete